MGTRALGGAAPVKAVVETVVDQTPVLAQSLLAARLTVDLPTRKSWYLLESLGWYWSIVSRRTRKLSRSPYPGHRFGHRHHLVYDALLVAMRSSEQCSLMLFPDNVSGVDKHERPQGWLTFILLTTRARGLLRRPTALGRRYLQSWSR